ncbi:MAG: CPBP family intramembrane metalloprotease, partial [Planctomycetales bacterium]|nr:CPBP family intramembrane metalloprotease [Planctomycetales bacterium]
ELLHREQSDRSREALDLVESALNRLNLEFYRRLTPRPLRRPPLTESRRVAIAGEPGARVTALGSLVPLILIMMTVTGAVYPSIDLTAGERERSTMETLLAAPVSRFRVLIAKYVAVVTVALLTATVNLGAMTATVYAGGLSELVFGKSGLDLQTIMAVFALLVIFAAFFSAVLLMITSTARSFKEAQAYLIPLMLVSLGPGLISLLPDIELQSWLAAAPLINVVLLARDLFQGAPLRWPALVALGSTVVYATLALAAAAQVFGKDAVSQAPSTSLRGKGGIATAPSPRGAMLTLVLLSPLYYWVGGLVYQIAFRSQSSQLVFSALATAILFAGVPMLACGVERVRLAPGFRLRRPPLVSLPAAVLLGLSIWPFAHQLVLLGQQLGMYDLSIARLEQVRAHLSAWRALPLPLLLATLAAAPALFEELFFRGFLFRALERKWSARSTVLVTAVLFGGFHVVSGRLLTPERFMPSTLIGLFLGFLAWRTRSVWPGVLAHFCNNAVLLSMAYYKDELMQSGIDVQQQQSLPGHWLLAAIIACAVGVGLLLLVRRPAEDPKP